MDVSDLLGSGGWTSPSVGERDSVDMTDVEILSSSGRPESGVVAGVVMTV